MVGSPNSLVGYPNGPVEITIEKKVDKTQQWPLTIHWPLTVDPHRSGPLYRPQNSMASIITVSQLICPNGTNHSFLGSLSISRWSISNTVLHSSWSWSWSCLLDWGISQGWFLSNLKYIKVEIEHSNHEMKYIKANIFKIGRNLADFSWFWRWEMSQCTMGNGHNGTMLEYGSL